MPGRGLTLAILIFTSFVLCQCVTGSAQSRPLPGLRQANLSQAQAAWRSEHLKDVVYELRLSLSGQADAFKGQLKAEFTLLQAPSDELFLDFEQDGTVTQVLVNGKPEAKIRYTESRLWLSKDLLRSGRNRIEVAYSHRYTNDGSGLFRYSDSDGVYVFTQFEPFYANSVFPCFDQPDLRAKLALSVEAPSAWKVITATRETSIAQLPNERSLWIFKTTPPLSTYLFSLHAGPFQVWKSEARAGSKMIPLRLFARKEVATDIDPESWFKPARQGFAYFTREFEVPYAFEKFDQVLAPSFTSGAMENVAAITYTEEYIDRGQPTREDKEAQSNVILHELAHQWFGNLVTMKWWNGLWLNESFASYMATLAQSEASEFQSSWATFHDEMKAAAYREDEYPTSHPVDSAIPDTQSAFALFDGITYGKGGAALQQLAFTLGGGTFREGMRRYFKAHAYSNTELSDFVSALSSAAGRDLTPWFADWIQTTGIDTVSASFSCSQGRLSSLKVLASSAKNSRQHRMGIGLYRRGSTSSQLERFSTINIDYRSGETDVPLSTRHVCPEFILLNEGDRDYAKFLVDPVSLKQLFADGRVPAQSLSRLVLWTSLFQMVKDGKIHPRDYIELAVRALAHERDAKVAAAIQHQLGGVRAGRIESVLYYLQPSSGNGSGNGSGAGTGKTADELQIALENILWRRFSHAQNTEEKNLTFDNFVRVARSQKGAAKLASLFSVQRAGRYTLDQDRRWDALIRLSSLGMPEAPAWIAAERSRDKSEFGTQMALGSEAAVPTLDVKRKWFAKLLSEQALPLAQAINLMEHILPAWQNDLRWQLGEDFYRVLPEVASKRDQEFVEKFAAAFVPAVCTKESAAKLNAFLKKEGQRLPPAVLKTLRIELHSDELCLRLRLTAPQS